MKKYLYLQQQENKEIISLKATHEDVFTQQPILVKAIGKLTTYSSQIDDLLKIYELDSKAATVSKCQDQENLLDKLYPLCVKLSGYAKENHLNELYNGTHYSRSKIVRMNVNLQLNLADTCLKWMDVNQDLWEAVGIDQAQVDDLSTAKQKLVESKRKASNIRSQQKLAHSLAEELLKKNRSLIHQDIEPKIKAASYQKAPDVWIAFENILAQYSNKTKQLAVKGQLVDSETGKPILFARLREDRLKMNYRLRSKKGNFQIRKLEPGSYVLKFEHEYYQTTEVQFVHAWGITNHLQVRMKMKESAKRMLKDKQTEQEPDVVEM
jgi:hypothetical protein